MIYVVAPMEAGKGSDYHLNQLGEETVAHLLDLDLANKPNAQMPLLGFLLAMGVGEDRIKKSRVAQAMRNSADMTKLAKDPRTWEQIARLSRP